MPEIPILRSTEPQKQVKEVHHHAAKAKIIQSDHAYGASMLMICWDEWGHLKDEHGHVAFLKWHPATLRMELNQTFGIDTPPGNFDRLMAAITIVTTDLFFRNLRCFSSLCDVLSGGVFDYNSFEPPTLKECAWGITEGLLLMPPDDDPEPFSDEIRHYIGHRLREEGYLSAPDILKIALGAPTNKPLQEHAHDPELVKEIRKNQEAKTRDIEIVIREGITELVTQLKQLHLQNGTTEELEKRLSAMLKAI
jgi:hypothetical protein